MSNYGVGTVGESGAIYMYSPNMTGVFYRANGVYSGSATIPSSGFVNQYSIATPVETPSFSFTATAGTGDVINLSGTVSSNGQYFYAPTALATGDNCYQYPPTLNSIATQINTFGTPTVDATGYGMVVTGSATNSVAINQNYQSYYVHPQSDGTFLRSGSCTSLASSTSFVVTTYDVPTTGGTVIYFEKPFDNPPLIFVTETSGPIALNYMLTDVDGKYIGASIVAASSISTPSVLTGPGWFTPNTYTFTWFLVSNEEPLYAPTTNYGMKVWAGSPSFQKVFDSSYFSPLLQAIEVGKVWQYLDGEYPISAGCAYTSSGGTYYWNHITGTKTYNFGICLNNLNTMCGYTRWTQFVGAPGDPYGQGNASFYGRFANITSTTIEITAQGSNAVYCQSYPAQGWAASYDFSIDSDPNMTILFANYEWLV